MFSYELEILWIDYFEYVGINLNGLRNYNEN